MADRLCTVKEMAALLNVPVSWIYQRTCQGSQAIPYIKVGKYVRFNSEDVLEFFKKQGALSGTNDNIQAC